MMFLLSALVKSSNVKGKRKNATEGKKIMSRKAEVGDSASAWRVLFTVVWLELQRGP